MLVRVSVVLLLLRAGELVSARAHFNSLNIKPSRHLVEEALHSLLQAAVMDEEEEVGGTTITIQHLDGTSPRFQVSRFSVGNARGDKQVVISNLPRDPIAITVEKFNEAGQRAGHFVYTLQFVSEQIQLTFNSNVDGGMWMRLDPCDILFLKLRIAIGVGAAPFFAEIFNIADMKATVHFGHQFEFRWTKLVAFLPDAPGQLEDALANGFFDLGHVPEQFHFTNPDHLTDHSFLIRQAC